MGFSRQEYQSGWPFPSPGYLPDPGIIPTSHVSSFHGILQTRIPEGVAMPSSRGPSRPRDHTHVSCLLLPWDSPDKNTGGGCHALLQGDLPSPGTELTSLASPALAGEFFTTAPPGKPLRGEYVSLTMTAPQGHLHSLACDHIQSKSFQPLLPSSFFVFTLSLTPQPISYIGTTWII